MSSSKTFVLGDVHGAFKALIQVLKQANFDYENDTLIALGDVCDGWPQTKESFDELLKIKNLVYILGNHDFWSLQWMEEDTKDDIWLSQGGQATIDSYAGTPDPVHLNLLKNAHDYYLLNNKLFVHGGIAINLSLEKQTKQTLLWDRTLITRAMALHTANQHENLTGYDEVYIGHTPIHRFGYLNPTQACEVWMMDTGAGWDGVLSLMDIETKEYFTSNKIPGLYPNHLGRF